MRKRSGLFIIGLLTISVCIISLCQEANGQGSSEKKCLIIISGLDGYSDHEVGKSASFRNHLLQNCSMNDICYLTDPSQSFSDGPANLSNIVNAIEWLKGCSGPNTEVTVYVFDHILMIDNEATLLFDDTNISLQIFDSWLDQVQCSKMTVILNGERSSLAGPDLSGPSRNVICSMGSGQTYDPDLFNITRSLEDPTADMNDDEIVDYIEAYWKEVENLQGSGQDPIIFL